MFEINPYEDNPTLSPTESLLLWEYAKLAIHVKHLAAATKQLTLQPDDAILPRLRILERKMSLVLTLFKASVWGLINEDPSIDTATTTAM